MLDSYKSGCEDIIEQLNANVARNRELREQTRDLLHANSDLREFLRESVLMSMALRQSVANEKARSRARRGPLRPVSWLTP